MSLPPPPTVEKLQKALHTKAKESPDYRFYALYDKVYRRDILGFFAYPPEKVYSRPYPVTADGADGVPPRHLACLVNWTGRLCPTELTRPYPASILA